MFVAQHLVVRVVGWGYFQATCTKFYIYVLIFDNRNHTVADRHNRFFAFEVLPTLIVRVDADSRITKNRFGACCSNYKVLIRPFNLIFQMIQKSLTFFINHFLVRKSGFSLWIPVHHTVAAVYLSFVVQIHKYFDNRSRKLLVHCEFSAFPVARAT